MFGTKPYRNLLKRECRLISTTGDSSSTKHTNRANQKRPQSTHKKRIKKSVDKNGMQHKHRKYLKPKIINARYLIPYAKNSNGKDA